MKGITPEKQDVIRLSFLAEFSEAEVAECLGIPPGTVKTRKKYAREGMLDAMLCRHLNSLPRKLESWCVCTFWD